MLSAIKFMYSKMYVTMWVAGIIALAMLYLSLTMQQDVYPAMCVVK